MASVKLARFYGINNVLDATSFGFKGMTKAENVDIGPAGNKIYRRPGFIKGTTDSNFTPHSMFSHRDTTVFAEGDTLYKITGVSATGTVTFSPISTHPIALSTVRYVGVGGAIYYTDGVLSGAISGGRVRSWGLTPPTTQPVATEGTGSVPEGLRAGDYALAATYVRTDGQESGTPIPRRFSIVGSAVPLDISAIPVSADPDVESVRIHLSAPNGTELYHVGTVPNGTTSVRFTGDPTQAGAVLKTVGHGPPPVGDLVAYYRGRVYVVKGDVIYYSDARNLELFHYANFIPIGAPITMIAPVHGGIYIGGPGMVGFLDGDSPDKFTFTEFDLSPPILGSMVVVDGSFIDNENVNSLTALWASEDGIMMGSSTGIVYNVTGKYYLPDTAQESASTVVSRNGGMNFLFTLKDPTSNPTAVQHPQPTIFKDM